MAKRGRPIYSSTLPEDQPRKFTREYNDKKTGYKSVWTYDYNKFKNGLVSVEIFYPETEKAVFVQDPTSKNIPKTRRKYINPKNGKLIAFFRAKQLGLIK